MRKVRTSAGFRKVKKLRLEKGLTLEKVAKRIGSHKGYVSGIENDKVNPPSVRIVKKYAKLFSQDPLPLIRLAWVDKAPAELREDADKFLRWCELGSPLPAGPGEGPAGRTIARPADGGSSAEAPPG